MGTARHAHFALTDFARQEDSDELVIPDDLTTLDDEALSGLLDSALEAFKAIRDTDEDISEEALEQLAEIRDGIVQLREEITKREAAKAERAEKAAAISAEIEPPAAEADAEADESADAEDCEDCDEADGENADETAEVTAEAVEETGEVDTSNVPDDASEITESQPEPVAASANRPAKRKSTRVNLSGIRARQARTPRPQVSNPQTMRDIVTAAPDFPGFANGQGMDWLDVGRGIDQRLRGFNPGQFERAAREHRHLKQQFSVAAIRKPFTEDLMVRSEDAAHIDSVIGRAVDEKRLSGGSLVASGGWCAPSETVYDLCQLESRDGMLSIPEIGITRGGINLATGPDFSELYNNSGFCYTEEEDIAGDYDGEGGGSKPCFTVPCPEFTEYRLDACGLCVSAGLLQAKGYPEAIARTTSGVMIAYEHRMNAKTINDLVAGSTAVTMPSPSAGATAPLLEAIELQVELIKQRERMSRGTSMEGIFPYWVRGLVRADLSRRLGVDLIDVPDARINAWFTQRGIAAQFVYDWQPLADTAVAYPDTVDFLLYPAGAWVRGTSDIISLDTIYDSTLLGTNDYTALFFEEGYLVAPRCGESRVVTVSTCPNGSTHAGELIGCDGTSGGSAS